jgi:hypothetical protein
MAKISTEGRIFAAQVTRDLAAREAAAAAMLMPGTKTWYDAFTAFAQATSKTGGGPIRAGKFFWDACNRLMAAQNEHHACFINFFYHRKRSGHFEVLTYERDTHPLTNSGNEGIVVKVYQCRLSRNGFIELIRGIPIAFCSWHALGRMAERSKAKADIFDAKGAVAACGLAGKLLHRSAKHAGTEIHVAFSEFVCAGILRFREDDTDRLFGFYDVLTTLPRLDVERLNPRAWEQGCKLASGVNRYIKSDDSNSAGYSEHVPVLDFRGFDYISREFSTSKKKDLDETAVTNS